MIPLSWKLIAAGILLAALGGLLWHDHHMTKVAKERAEKIKTLNANLAAKDKLIAVIRDDQRKADESAAIAEAKLARIHNEPPIAGVRCRAPASLPAQSGAAAVIDGAATSAIPSVPDGDPSGGGPDQERDVSAGLDWYGEHCSTQAVRQGGLQGWELNRTH